MADRHNNKNKISDYLVGNDQITPVTITVITITFTKKTKEQKGANSNIYGLIKTKEISLSSVRRSKIREERTFLLNAINLPGKSCHGN